MTFVLRLSNSGLSAATRPSSVVHTGVKSFGCENRTAQLSPFQSWKLIVPSVVSAVKSGASSPRRIAIAASSVGDEIDTLATRRGKPTNSVGFSGVGLVADVTLTDQANARYS